MDRYLVNKARACSTLSFFFFLKKWNTSLCGMYYIGQKVCMYGVFWKIKDTFFIFTNNFIDLGILSMSAISHLV